MFPRQAQRFHMKPNSGLILKQYEHPPKPLGAVDASYIPRVYVDNMSGVLPPSDQGTTEECVAYALAGWIESYRWQELGIRQQIDPHQIYVEAKKLDGMPDQPGTSLEAGLDAASNLGLFKDLKRDSILQITARDVRRALHQYGYVLAAFAATKGWLTPSPSGWIGPDETIISGHAVLLCAYDDAPNEGVPFIAWQDNYGLSRGFNGFCRMTWEQFNQQFDHGLVWDCTL